MPLIDPYVFSDAVRYFWQTREAQGTRGALDQGNRREATGGRQMDRFAEILSDLMVKAGVQRADIHRGKRLADLHSTTSGVELPGFYRATKKWDVVVVQQERLVAALELKSLIGPSFGNNLNNRVEEAIGSAGDFWTAFREGAFSISPQPWIGYLFLMQDCPKSERPVKVQEPHFHVFPEFRGASYARRAELLCLKLVRERQYNAACYLLADRNNAGRRDNYTEPNLELAANQFLTSLLRHVAQLNIS